MFYIKKILFCYVFCVINFSIQAQKLPLDISGVATYDYFTESLPDKSRGVYQIWSSNEVKYIGSAKDINKQLVSHCKNGILVPGDMVHAVIFHASAKQKAILNCQEKLIKELTPSLNKHDNAHTQSLTPEKILERDTSFQDNQTILTQKEQVEIQVIETEETSQAKKIPSCVSGVATYDYFTESLPDESRGIYQIWSSNKVKYIGSAKDINKRLASHHKNGRLVPGDAIHAIIFRPDTRQVEILGYEKLLIKKNAPSLNKHTGAPGRPWESEKMLKLDTFFQHNKTLLTTKGQNDVRAILAGKTLRENNNLKKILFRMIGLFR